MALPALLGPLLTGAAIAGTGLMVPGVTQKPRDLGEDLGFDLTGRVKKRSASALRGAFMDPGLNDAIDDLIFNSGEEYLSQRMIPMARQFDWLPGLSDPEFDDPLWRAKNSLGPDVRTLQEMAVRGRPSFTRLAAQAGVL